MLSDFRVKPYRSKRIDEYAKRMMTPRTDDDKVIDQIMVAVLKKQGFSWPHNSSSTYDPQALFDALANYSPSKAVRINMKTPSWERAIKATFKVFAKPKHYPYLNTASSISEIRESLKLEKSSGLPSMTSKEDDFYYALNRRSQILAGKKVPSPCIAYKRTQLGGKTRLVWGYPLSMTIMESVFARPLIEILMDRNTTMAAGIPKFELGGRIAAIDNSYGQTLGLDFSKFDSTISKDLIYMAFNILATWFDPSERDEFGWKQIVSYFIHTPIVMPNKKLYTGKQHGVPSGSYFTQLIDSVVNTAVQFWLAEELGYSLSWEKFLVLGDDVIISIPKEINLEAIAEKLAEIGLIMHPHKTKKEAHFLGATWIKGIPYRDTTELLQKMVYPENYRKYPSENRLDRMWLAYMLISQYASAYANAIEILENFFGTGNPGMVDESITNVTKANGIPEWEDKYSVSALEFVGRSGKSLKTLSSRLFA